jgi:Phage tail lysozyme
VSKYEDEAARYLLSQGVSPLQAAGIVGNLAQESNLNPTVRGDNGSAYGLAQWRLDRRSALEGFARQRGGHHADPYTQLDFLLHEARQRGDLSAMGSAQTPGQAAKIFADRYERPSPQHANYANRGSTAERVYQRLASVQHGHGMLQKYSPSFAQRTADFFVHPAYGADQPQGPGVMRDDGGFSADLQQASAEPDEFQRDLQQAIASTPTTAPQDDGFAADLQAAISSPAPQATAPQSGMSPTLQANLRSTVKGLSAPVTMAMDAVNAVPNLIAKGVNTVRPGTMDYLAPGQEMVDKGLRSAGINPEPQSGAERAVTAALGAAAGSPLFGAASLASAPTQALGAAASSAAVDMAQAAGVGPAGQLAAGVVGGMAPGVGMSAMRGVGNTINRGTAPFRPGGKEAIAGRLLNKQASAPQTVLNRVDDPSINRAIIPGSAPTLAEVSQDPGISQLQRGMGRIGLDAGVDQINAVRVSQLDNLIHETLDRVNKNRGGRDTVEAVRAVKHRIGAEFEQGLAARGIDTMALPVAPQTLSDRIKELARKHEGNDALTGLIAKVSTQLGDEAPSFNKLWNMRQSLDDSIYEKWATASSASKGDMKRVGEQLRSAMNADLVAAVPEFQPFLSRYARMSRAEGRLKLGRKLKEGVQNMGSGIAGEGQLYGERTVSLDKLQKIDFDKAQQRAGATLAPYQREAFDAATAEKRRANFLFSGGQAPRSDTAQNLALDQVISDDILGGLLGDNSGQTGLVGIMRGIGQNTLGAPLTALTRSAKNDILRLVAKGLIDPQEGARLMRLGTLKQSESFAKKLQSGAETGVLSSIYSNMVR